MRKIVLSSLKSYETVLPPFDAKIAPMLTNDLQLYLLID